MHARAWSLMLPGRVLTTGDAWAHPMLYSETPKSTTLRDTSPGNSQAEDLLWAYKFRGICVVTRFIRNAERIAVR